MTKEEGKIKVDGVVIEALPGTQFRVKLDNGHEVLAYLSGKMRKHYIRILLGDRVAMEMSPYDLTRARITFRQRKNREIVFLPRSFLRKSESGILVRWSVIASTEPSVISPQPRERRIGRLSFTPDSSASQPLRFISAR